MIRQFFLYKSNDFESSKECHLPAKIFCKLDRYTERSSLWPLKRPQRQCFLEKKQILGQFREKNTQKQDRYYAIIKVNELRKEAVHK